MRISDLPPKARAQAHKKYLSQQKSNGKEPKTKSKYGNHKVKMFGIEFDSAKEANRWFNLTILEKSGAISDLRRQVKFVLIPTQRKDGRVIERECAYYADFVYVDSEGKTIVEDTKGFRTPEYIIKRKLMLEKYGIEVNEV